MEYKKSKGKIAPDRSISRTCSGGYESNKGQNPKEEVNAQITSVSPGRAEFLHGGVALGSSSLG